MELNLMIDSKENKWLHCFCGINNIAFRLHCSK